MFLHVFATPLLSPWIFNMQAEVREQFPDRSCFTSEERQQWSLLCRAARLKNWFNFNSKINKKDFKIQLIFYKENFIESHKINKCSFVFPSSAGRELETLYYRVIPYVAGSCSKVNDGCSFWTAVGKGVHVSHHIVTQLLLLLCCHLEVNVVQICFHLAYLLICDWKPKWLQGEKNFYCFFSLPTNWDRSCLNNLLPSDISQKWDNLV